MQRQITIRSAQHQAEIESKLQAAEITFNEIQELHRKFARIAAILSRMIADSTAFYNARKQK